MALPTLPFLQICPLRFLQTRELKRQALLRGFEVIKARVPLAELYRYSTTLSSLSSGSATFTMEFADYQPVPGDVQDKLLKAYMEEEKED